MRLLTDIDGNIPPCGARCGHRCACLTFRQATDSQIESITERVIRDVNWWRCVPQRVDGNFAADVCADLGALGIRIAIARLFLVPDLPKMILRGLGPADGANPAGSTQIDDFLLHTVEPGERDCCRTAEIVHRMRVGLGERRCERTDLALHAVGDWRIHTLTVLAAISRTDIAIVARTATRRWRRRRPAPTPTCSGDAKSGIRRNH